MEVRQLPSGLLVASSEGAEPAPPADPIICSRCGTQSAESGLWVHRTKDGFRSTDPTCGHGRYVMCPGCGVESGGCPVCGCREEYT